MSYIAALTEFGEQVALVNDRNEKLTYLSLLNQVDLLAGQFSGGKKLVFVRCKNNFSTIIGYLAAIKSNNTVLMLDAKLSNELFGHLVDIFHPDFIWQPVGDNEEYKLTVIQSKTDHVLHPDLTLLLSTSGSLGSPKLVKLTEKNILSNARSIIEYLGITETERAITTLPLHYSYGLSILNSHLLSGATLLLTDEPVTSRKFWDFFKTHDATSFGGVPYTYEMLSRLRFERMSLPSLRYMTQAGGKLDVNLVKSFAQVAADMGCKFYVMYGQTEATARISYLSSELVSDNPSSIGVAIPGGKVWIEDADHQLIDSAGIEGDLVYQGDNVMMGYAESRKDLALGDELKGILRTGDIAKKDEQGLYYIVGRSKRFIKIFGNRVNLEDIELQLKKMNFDCVCGGIDNDLKVACLLGNDVNKIKQYIVEQYKFHHSVVDVRKVKEFTKNSSGKILYQEIFSNWELT